MRDGPTCRHSSRSWCRSTDSTAPRSRERSPRRATSRRSSRRCSGRCSSRRNGTSTRHRSCRGRASTAASPGGTGMPRNSRAPRRRSACRPRSWSRSSASRRSTARTPAVTARSTRLTTLAFDYPRRAAFFRGELKQFLLLARDLGAPPATLKGSFAGALGVPQFMPGSYRNFAVDFDGDGRIDLWTDSADVVGSVANYLARHDWQRGQPVLLPAVVAPDGRDAVLRRLDGGLSERRSLGGVGRRRRHRHRARRLRARSGRAAAARRKVRPAATTRATGSRATTSTSSPATTAAACTRRRCGSSPRPSRVARAAQTP